MQVQVERNTDRRTSYAGIDIAFRDLGGWCARKINASTVEPIVL